MPRLLLRAFLFVLAVWCFNECDAEENRQDREVYETEVKVAVSDVWDAFTTGEGLRAWMAPVVDIELKVGGKLRANYNAAGSLDDETTIENTILSYDPQRMLSLKVTRFPAGFPFAEAARPTWSVFYFTPLDDSRTRITVVGLGYTDQPQSQAMRAAFAAANRQVLDKLAKLLEKR